jgi:hypothetical protein
MKYFNQIHGKIKTTSWVMASQNVLLLVFKKPAGNCPCRFGFRIHFEYYCK